MARTRPDEPDPRLRIARSELDRQLGERIGLGQEFLDRQVSNADAVEELRREFYTWDEYNERLLRSRFSSGKVADAYRMVAFSFGGGLSTPQQELRSVHVDLTAQMRKLVSLRGQLELYDSNVEETEPTPRGSPLGNRIFVVHGHDGNTKYEVAEYLEQVTGKRPVILHEQADSGRTIIEKFEAHASEAGFAVVLLTADDVGRANTEDELKPRARQNVVLELGFFIGRLGRSRVVALYEAGVELPSDLSGVLYTALATNWHTALAKELRAAGIEVDLSKL